MYQRTARVSTRGSVRRCFFLFAFSMAAPPFVRQPLLRCVPDRAGRSIRGSRPCALGPERIHRKTHVQRRCSRSDRLQVHLRADRGVPRRGNSRGHDPVPVEGDLQRPSSEARLSRFPRVGRQPRRIWIASLTDLNAFPVPRDRPSTIRESPTGAQAGGASCAAGVDVRPFKLHGVRAATRVQLD